MKKAELLYYTLKNQYLLEKATKSEVVTNLCGLQAQFANNPKYALQIRSYDYHSNNWGDNLVKIWSFRSTLHAINSSEIGMYLSARSVRKDWEDSWTGLKKEVKPYWSDFLYENIKAGVNEREDLKTQCRLHGMQQEMLEQVFHGWGGLLKEMCDRGRIAYEIGTSKRFVICENVNWVEKDQARAYFIQKYFKYFAPATIEDCASFTGYKKREISELVHKYNIPLKSVLCEGVEYYYIGDLDGDCKIPGCIYLAGFDQLIMGYKDRTRIMADQDRRKVITNSGIVFPTILINGKVKAKWRKDKDSLYITPFTKLSNQHRDRIISRGKKLFRDEIKSITFVE